MSKKKKKFNREEIQKRLSQLEKESTAKEQIPTVLKEDQKKKTNDQGQPKVITRGGEKTAGDFVLHDLKRLFIILSFVVLILVALIIINSKTNLLSTLGDRIFNFLNIS